MGNSEHNKERKYSIDSTDKAPTGQGALDGHVGICPQKKAAEGMRRTFENGI